MTDEEMEELKAVGYDPEKPWELEGKIMLRTLEWLVPLVDEHVKDTPRRADFNMLLFTLKWRFKMEPYIQTGLKVHSGAENRPMTEEERTLRIAVLKCSMEIMRQSGTDRGIAGKIKRKLKLKESERHIRRILAEK